MINIYYVLSLGMCINVVITLFLLLVQYGKHYVSLSITTTRCHRHTRLFCHFSMICKRFGLLWKIVILYFFLFYLLIFTYVYVWFMCQKGFNKRYDIGNLSKLSACCFDSSIPQKLICSYFYSFPSSLCGLGWIVWLHHCCPKWKQFYL